MYKRIEELAEGKVHTAAPVLAIEPDQVRLEPVEGAPASGYFTISSLNKVPMKGIVISSDPRMEVENPQFQGADDAQIRYEFHGNYMQEGEVAGGSFYIISNGGEYDLSWSVAVKRLYAEASTGRIATLDDFVRLYRANWREAVHVYSAPGFKKLLHGASEPLYYKLLGEKPATRANMEEFLVACGRKPRVFFSISEHAASYPHLSEAVEESVEVSLSDWGYTQAAVVSDADFVVPEKAQFDSDDCVGGHYRFRYRIYTELMHAGKNYARLTFENHLQRETLEIMAEADAVIDLEREDRRRTFQENYQLLRDYEGFLAGSVVMGEWARRTCATLSRRGADGSAGPMDVLWRAYALLMNRQNQDAEWILDEYRRGRDEGMDREWAFYLYLCTLTEKEQGLLDKMRQKIADIYRENHEDPWMRFIVMQLSDRSPESAGRQLKLMEQWFNGGLHSPFLYAFAASIYEAEPYLLLAIGSFELHVLNWICRRRRLTRDLAGQAARRAVSVKQYSRILDNVLEACYESYPEEDILAGLCAYRIRGQRYSEKDHAYYELAIEHDLQIAGLYEAFMASLDPRDVRMLPKAVQLYFQYSNHLSYSQKAVLYVNIIAHREEQPEMYDRYRQVMQDFAESEILSGHMDDNLAVVYAHVLEWMPLNEELAHALAKILYVNKFTCLGEPVAHVVVQQENLSRPQVYPVVSHRAYLSIYPGNYVILLQDAHGRRYALSSETQMERLLNPGRYIRKCLELAPDELPYVLHHMNGKTKLLHMDGAMAGYARALVRSEEVSDEFKSRISPGFLEYCRGGGYDGDIRGYLLKIDFGRLDRASKDRYLESLIQLKMYREAWTFLVQYGAGRLPLAALEQIVASQITGDSPEDGELLYFAEQCFLRGSLDRRVLEYLCAFYRGPSEKMSEIWHALSREHIPAAELEERLLIQMVFSGAFAPDVQEVFADYCANGGREQVRAAYLTYFSYEVFVNRMEAEPKLYYYLEQAVLGSRGANQYQRLALLERYSSLEVLTSEQERFADEMLDEYIARRQYFACFQRLPGRIGARHHLYDVCIVEYRSVSQNPKVWINYRITGRGRAFEKELLEPALANIYLWHACLAGGEQLEYYITEKGDRMENITESHVMNLPAVGLDNRFAKLSRMAERASAGDADGLCGEMRRYQAYDGLAGRLFRLL